MKHPGPFLTPGMLRLLQDIRDADDECVVIEGNQAWVGYRKTRISTVYSLLRLCLINECDNFDEAFQRYELTSDGRRLIDDPQGTPEIIRIFAEQK